MTKYAELYLEKLAQWVEPLQWPAKVDSMGFQYDAKGNPINLDSAMTRPMEDLYIGQARDAYKNWKDSRYFKSVGDNVAANAKSESAASNALGAVGQTALMFTGAGKAPGVSGFLSRTGSRLLRSAPVAALFGSGFTGAQAQDNYLKSPLGRFDEEIRQTFPDKANFSAKDNINFGKKLLDQRLQANTNVPTHVTKAIMDAPILERVSKLRGREDSISRLTAP